MSGEGIKSSWICPECGRESRLPEPRCWFCNAPRPGATEIATAPGPAPRSAEPPPDEDYPRPPTESESRGELRQHTAGCILMVCVMLVPFYGIGLALLVIMAPALYRLVRVRNDRQTGSPSWLSEIGEPTFAPMAAAGIAVLVVVSSIIAFVAVCGPTGSYAIMGMSGQPAPWPTVVWLCGLFGGLAAAGGLGYGIVALIFRRRKRE